MKTLKDSIELTNNLKVNIAINSKGVKIKWKPRPPYDIETMEAIQDHIDPWIQQRIQLYERQK